MNENLIYSIFLILIFESIECKKKDKITEFYEESLINEIEILNNLDAEIIDTASDTEPYSFIEEFIENIDIENKGWEKELIEEENIDSVEQIEKDILEIEEDIIVKDSEIFSENLEIEIKEQPSSKCKKIYQSSEIPDLWGFWTESALDENNNLYYTTHSLGFSIKLVKLSYLGEILGVFEPPYEECILGLPVIKNDMVYISCCINDLFSYLFKIDTLDMNLKAEYELGLEIGCFYAPIIDEKNNIVFIAKNKLYYLKEENNSVKMEWSNSDYYFTNIAIGIGNTIYADISHSNIVSFSDKGEKLWEGPFNPVEEWEEITTLLTIDGEGNILLGKGWPVLKNEDAYDWKGNKIFKISPQGKITNEYTFVNYNVLKKKYCYAPTAKEILVSPDNTVYVFLEPDEILVLSKELKLLWEFVSGKGGKSDCPEQNFATSIYPIGIDKDGISFFKIFPKIYYYGEPTPPYKIVGLDKDGNIFLEISEPMIAKTYILPGKLLLITPFSNSNSYIEYISIFECPVKGLAPFPWPKYFRNYRNNRLLNDPELF